MLFDVFYDTKIYKKNPFLKKRFPLIDAIVPCCAGRES
jgi:hypothetical protein